MPDPVNSRAPVVYRPVAYSALNEVQFLCRLMVTTNRADNTIPIYYGLLNLTGIPEIGDSIEVPPNTLLVNYPSAVLAVYDVRPNVMPATGAAMFGQTAVYDVSCLWDIPE